MPLEERDAGTLGRLSAPSRFPIRDPDEVHSFEFGERCGVRRSVDVGEADYTDLNTHSRTPGVTGLPDKTDSVAASPILSAS